MGRVWLPPSTDIARAISGTLPQNGVLPRGPLRINWSNPLAARLKSFVVVQNGQLIDLVSGRVAVETVSGGTFEYFNGVECFNTNGTGYYTIQNVGNSTALYNRTLFLSASLSDGSQHVEKGIIDLSSDFRIGHKFMTFAIIDTGWTSIKIFGHNFTFDERFRFSVNSKNNSQADVFIDGTSYINIGGTFRAYNMTNNANITIGKDITGVAKARIFSLAYFEPVLTTEEALSLSLDEYQLVESANDFAISVGVPAVGGTPTLSSPGVINVLSDRATPQVTLTF